jgi:hypothetical protein
MNDWGFLEKIFLAMIISVSSIVAAAGYEAGAGEAGRETARVITALGFFGATGVALWAIIGPILPFLFGGIAALYVGYYRLVEKGVGAIRRRRNRKAAALEAEVNKAAVEARRIEAERQSAPIALARASGNADLLLAVERADGAYAEWQAALSNHPNLGQRQLAHAMRTVQVACQDTLADPVLVNSTSAHQKLTDMMNALSQEFFEDIKKVEGDRLQALDINLSTLKRQVSLEINAVGELRT